jgi:hypothetical protein
VNAPEILPPFGRLNDIEKGFSLKISIVISPKFGQNLTTVLFLGFKPVGLTFMEREIST